MVALACLALGSGAGLAIGFGRHDSEDRADGGRALSASEARRLAAMRVTNYRDGRVGVHGTLGPPEAPTRIAGWVDWSRSLIYLAIDGPGTAAQHGLLQAVPGLLATRAAPATTPEPATTPDTAIKPDTPAISEPATRPAAPGVRTSAIVPPAVPPADGWQIRRLDADGPRPLPVDALVTLLFGIAAERPDPAEALAHGPARWLGRDQTAGNTVDVLLGPAAQAPVTADAGRSTPAPATLTEMSGAVRYWLDGDARLHRLETVLADGMPLAVALDRTAPPELIAIGGLGGGPVRPRAVTNAEADQLAQLRSTNRGRRGARVTFAVPTVPATTLGGGGWLDWRNGVAYLSVGELDKLAEVRLLRADQTGIAVRAAPDPAAGTGNRSPGARPSTGPGTRSPSRRPPTGTGASTPAPSATGGPGRHEVPLPPLPPPTERSWSFSNWEGRTDALGGLDLDLLINEALSCGGRIVDDPVGLRATAVWLRADTVGRRPVSVFEMPKPAEAGEPPGNARLRYWIDSSGLLRRLELRTRMGAFAQLDLAPGPVPYLAAVPLD